MFPDLPTSLSGAYVIEDQLDEECQGNLVTRLGKPFGLWYDDTTPDLDKWLALGVAKYRPLGQNVFVCVPPGRPGLHHKPCPPVVNVYERYVYGLGVAPEAWGPCPKYTAYVVQRNWPGTVGKNPPTRVQYRALLAEVQAHHPNFIFLF